MSSSATTHEHVQRMLDQIHRNYTERVTLSVFAKILERQSSYLGRLFRDEVGVTVHEYITRARMMFGAVQVRDGVKIEAVALELGYRSKKNFYRQFKRRFGMTPEKYRYEHDPVRNNQPVERVRRSDRTSEPSSSTLALEPHGDANGTANRGTRRGSWPASVGRWIARGLAGQQIAIVATDETGCCVAANEAAVSISGYSADELRGMPAQMLFPTAIITHGRSRLRILLPASSTVPPNAVLRTKSARAVRIHVTSVANLLGNSGRRPMAQTERETERLSVLAEEIHGERRS
jgi:PAS domain S-box-containing protein